jgi:hypothetical protein
VIAGALLKGGTDSKHSQSIQARQLGEVRTLWTTDERVLPWRGTALGVVQTFSTWRHHVQTMRTRGESHRAERNMIQAIAGHGLAADRKTVQTIREVVGAARMG